MFSPWYWVLGIGYWVLDIGLQGRHGAGVLSLQGYDAPIGSAGPHHQPQPLDDLRSAGSHHLLIATQQGVALRTVGDDRLGSGNGVYLSRYLDVGGKAGPARADDAGLFDSLNDLFRHLN